MIWVPKKEDCLVWNETEEGLYIVYFVDGNENKEFPIKFFWLKTPKINDKFEIYYEKEYNPAYLSVIECMNSEVLNCSSSICSAKPQLRYNKIINKWYCNCPSSAICTKNNDQEELEKMLCWIKDYTEENGFCDSPIEAILKWNEKCAKNYENIAKESLKKFESWKDKNLYFND